MVSEPATAVGMRTTAVPAAAPALVASNTPDAFTVEGADTVATPL
jgi:hypothetical protein